MLKITPKQRTKINALVRKTCCNCYKGNCCFPTGITAYDHEPLFTADMLVYGGRYYLIGEGHKEFAPDKIKDEDYYVLTLAAIAKELKAKNLTKAHIVIDAGLPLTWTSRQKADFKEYLMKNAEVEFSYKKADYHLYTDDVRIYPQGYAAIDAVFYLVITVIQIVAKLADVMLLSPDLRAAEKDLKQLVADYHFSQEHGIHTTADLQANIERSKSELSALERERSDISNRIRRSRLQKEQALYKERRKMVSKQMKPIREPLRRAERILEKSPHQYELLKQEHELEKKARARYKERGR